MISDISELFKPDFDSWSFVNDYIKTNNDCDPVQVSKAITNLKAVATRQLGCIVVNAECTIDEVTNIFIRINSKGAVLSQADFVMSKIAADETHGGSLLRKAIDYYCHLAVKPEFWSVISSQDTEFMTSEFAPLAQWLKNDHDDVYNPDYNDVLRVAFMYKFGRGKLADLVALLSGRDFEARDYRAEIADESFAQLRDGVVQFMREDNFQDFVLALRSAGFVSPTLIASAGAVNFAYNLYLRLRDDKSIPATDVKRWVQRWYVMSVLTGRYSGSPESRMDRDIRRINEEGFVAFYNEIVSASLSDAFWKVGLPQELKTTSKRTGAWLTYVAAQVKDADNTLFSDGVKVSDVVATIGDVHHIFPKKYLEKTLEAPQRLYNQLANYTYLERRINIKIANQCPGDYFTQALEACKGNLNYFGSIASEDELQQNLAANCIPEDIFLMDASDYQSFLEQRRQLMAAKIERYFKRL